MKFEIKNRWNGDTLHVVEAENIRYALEKLVTEGADLRGVDLGGADLGGANLGGVDLGGADLRGADLGGLTPYIKVPGLHQKILAALDAGGNLDMSDWHTCETTHCRAGWAVTLAGPAGAVLEVLTGPSVAGALITLASCPWMTKVPNFIDSDVNALADIKACAEKERELEAAAK